MLNYALLFLVIAIVAAIFGFGVAASAFAGIAKLLFWIFVIGFVVTMVMHYSRRRTWREMNVRPVSAVALTGHFVL